MLDFDSYAVGNKIFNIQILLIISQSLKLIGFADFSNYLIVLFVKMNVYFSLIINNSSIGLG